MLIFLTILLILFNAIYWTIVCKRLLLKYGYTEEYASSWSCWGFFFGPLAFIMAFTKPEVRNAEDISSKSDEIEKTIEKYRQLYESGVITEKAFEAYKEKLMGR